MNERDLEGYLNQDNSNNSNLFFITLTIREKVRSISELYKTTLDSYNQSSAGPPGTASGSKKKLEEFTGWLIDAAKEAINQFDFLIADQLIDDENDSPEPPKETL